MSKVEARFDTKIALAVANAIYRKKGYVKTTEADYGERKSNKSLVLEELAKENIKVDVNGTGVITLSINNVDSDTDEFAGTFEAIQPSDTDMGSKDPLDVKIIGELYGRKA